MGIPSGQHTRVAPLIQHFDTIRNLRMEWHTQTQFNGLVKGSINLVSSQDNFFHTVGKNSPYSILVSMIDDVMYISSKAFTPELMQHKMECIHHFNKSIWLELQDLCVCNKNRSGHWPDYSSPPCKVCLGTRLLSMPVLDLWWHAVKHGIDEIA